MKTVLCVIICYCISFSYGGGSIRQVMAQDPFQDSEINLASKNKTLGDILETISKDTGYQFNLKDKWKDYPVSISNDEMPLEHKLKRLLRSLNHIIIWGSDKTITIKIFGKVDPLKFRPATSPPDRRRINQVKNKPVMASDNEPAVPPEPDDANVEETHVIDGGEDVEKSEPGDDEPTQQEGDPDEQSEQDSPETDEASDDTTA